MNTRARGRRWVGTRMLLCALVGIAFLGPNRGQVPACHAAGSPADPAADEAAPSTAEERTFGDFRVRIVDGEERVLEIYKGGKRRFRKVYASASVAFEVEERQELVGTDVTGDGKPDLVVYANCGGTACGDASDAIVLSLEPQVRELAVIYGSGGETPRFRDIDGDGRLEVEIPDVDAYVSRYDYFLVEEGPMVVRRWDGKRFAVHCALMRKPAPDMAELEKEAAAIRGDEDESNSFELSNVPSAATQRALELMYGGHEDLGWKFLSMALSPKKPLPESFRRDFRRIMERSSWPEVRKCYATKR